MSELCVSVVMVTYQSARHIGPCLDSLLRTAQLLLKDCVVVDNASTDGSAQAVKTNYAWVTLLENSENLGFSRAVNQGIRQSRGEFVLIVNPDTVFEPDAVAELALFLTHRRPAAACGPKIVGPDGTFRRSSRRGFPTPLNSLGYLTGLDRLFPHSRAIGGYQRRGLSEDLEVITDSLSGSCMMVRRECFDGVQGFDEDYFLFGEDIDLCWKLKQAGFEIWYVPSARVMHVKGASMGFAPDRAKHEFYRAMRLFVDKRLTGRYPKSVLWATKLGVTWAEKWSLRFHRSRKLPEPPAAVSVPSV
jgi:O-antigen biosynthesis protein